MSLFTTYSSILLLGLVRTHTHHITNIYSLLTFNCADKKQRLDFILLSCVVEPPRLHLQCDTLWSFLSSSDDLLMMMMMTTSIAIATILPLLCITSLFLCFFHWQLFFDVSFNHYTIIFDVIFIQAKQQKLQKPKGLDHIGLCKTQSFRLLGDVWKISFGGKYLVENVRW